MTELITTLKAWFETQFTNNEVFAGVIGGSIIGSLLYTARSLPMRIVNLIRMGVERRFSREITVTNGRLDAFERILAWLIEEGATTNQSRFMADFIWMASKPGTPYDLQQSKMTIPTGRSWFWRKRCLYVLHRSFEEGGQDMMKRETLVIRVWSRDIERVREIAMAGSVKKRREIKIWVSTSNYWKHLSVPLERPVDSIFLEKGKLEEVVEDMGRFLTMGEKYHEMGIPHQRGYLFYGPPGTGKSSLAGALASHFEMDVAIMPLGGMTDSELAAAFSEIGPRSLILLDDVDEASSATHSKKGEKPKTEPDLTLSGLLQAMDGMFAGAGGTVVVMTTNHPERLDDRLTRSGRVDFQMEFEKATRETVDRMVRYHLEGAPEWVEALDYPIATADVQQKILKECWSPEGR